LKFELILITYTYFPITQNGLELKWVMDFFLNPTVYIFTLMSLPVFESYFFNHYGWDTDRDNIIWNVTVNKTMSSNY